METSKKLSQQVIYFKIYKYNKDIHDSGVEVEWQEEHNIISA